MKAVDAHCHLDFEQFDSDREEVIEKSRQKMEFIVNPGTCRENNRKVLELAEKYPEFITANLGLHPTATESFSEIEEVKQQIRENDPAAIGEIGMDYHHCQGEDERDRQEKVFRELLELAEELEKPVVVHSRDAEKQTVNIIEEYKLPEVFMHCFNGKPELAEEIAGRNWLIGVTTQVLYSSRVQEIAKAIPLENMVLETDSPFLYRDGRNEPLNVLESAEKVAEFRNVEKSKVVEVTAQNSFKFFRQ